MPEWDAKMSMLTRCPNCQTTFRVTDEQLEAYQGKVRCGRCANVFNGGDYLTKLERPVTTETETAEIDAQIPANEPEQIAVIETPAEEPMPASPVEIPEVEIREELAEPAPISSPPTTLATPEIFASKMKQRTQKTSLGIRQVAKKKPSVWAKRVKRILLGLVILILLTLLIAQAIYYFRTQIMVAYPPAKPLFQNVCAVLKCQLPLPRQSELLDIESSDLQADATRPGVVLLSATLRNRAPFNQAYPALELNLFDLQGQLVARRLLTPVEYVRKNIASGIEANGEIEVKVTLDSSALKFVGYRLNVLYP